MNAIVNKFLLAGDKFMSEMHLRQPGWTYSPCDLFTKNKERIKEFKQTGDSKYIYLNELDKACFQHDMTYGDFKHLSRRTFADKVLRDKAFIIPKDLEHDGYQHGIASITYNFFDKKTSDSSIENTSNKELAKELHKPIVRKLNYRKVHSPFIDNIWGADLADMLLINRFKKGIRFLLCVIDIVSIYAWAIPLKDKKRITITNAFQNMLKEFNRKPNKIWVDKGS